MQNTQLLRTITLAAAAVTAIVAENINVSQIATSARTVNWSEEASTPVAASGANITYYQMGRARVQGDASDYFAPGPWSAAWTNVALYPHVVRQVNTPAPTQQLAFGSPYYRLATVVMGGSPKRVQSRTFSTGWATAAVNYSVRVDHYSWTASDYFVIVNHPTIQRTVQAAYTLQSGGPGGSGGTYLYKSPDSARARAAVDVLVNGLPVWSSESTYMYPEGTASYPWDKLETTWGNTVTPNSQTKLYLGQLSAGKSITVTFIVRTDAHADADQCGIESGSWNSPDTKRCFDLTQTVELNGLSTGPVSFMVYAKRLNTLGGVITPTQPLPWLKF